MMLKLFCVVLQEFWVGNEELVNIYDKRLGDAGYINLKLARTNNRGDGILVVLVISVVFHYGIWVYSLDLRYILCSSVKSGCSVTREQAVLTENIAFSWPLFRLCSYVKTGMLAELPDWIYLWFLYICHFLRIFGVCLVWSIQYVLLYIDWITDVFWTLCKNRRNTRTNKKS